MMVETLAEAKAALQAEGLHVSSYVPHGLWIAGSLVDSGDGIHLSHDACVLMEEAERVVAGFPADGMLAYEVPGSLSDLVALILAVYHDHRRNGGDFKDAVKRRVANPEQYLTGRSPAPV